MPLAPSLLSVLRRRKFWDNYFWMPEAEDPYPELKDVPIEFRISEDYALVLVLDEYLLYDSLNLRPPGSENLIEIARDDQAHWHPHVLRWEELDAISRCVARHDPDYPHPGLSLLLLYRFAPITVGDDAPAIFRALEQAWRWLGLFKDREHIELAGRFDYRAAGFVWKPDPNYGWIIHQEENLGRTARPLSDAALYTTRYPGSEVFPFEPFNCLIEAAGRCTEGD